MNKLRPCPFCGGKLRLKDNSVGGFEVKHDDTPCFMPDEVEMQCNIEMLIALLNRRPIEDALQKRIDELEAKNARLKSEIVRTQNRDCFTCKYLDSYNMKCTLPVATCVNYAMWKGKEYV